MTQGIEASEQPIIANPDEDRVDSSPDDIVSDPNVQFSVDKTSLRTPEGYRRLREEGGRTVFLANGYAVTRNPDESNNSPFVEGAHYERDFGFTPELFHALKESGLEPSTAAFYEAALKETDPELVGESLAALRKLDSQLDGIKVVHVVFTASGSINADVGYVYDTSAED